MPIIKNLPSYYAKSNYLNNLSLAQDNEISLFSEYVEDTKNQFFVSSAIRSLSSYEEEYGLEQNPVGISIEDRRSRIKARMRTAGTSTKALVQNVISSWANSDIYITEHYSNLNEINYNAANWAEWTKDVGVTADAGGLKFTHNGQEFIAASINTNLKPSTKYGFLFNVAERTDGDNQLYIGGDVTEPTFARSSIAYDDNNVMARVNIPRFNNGLRIEEATTNLLPNTAAYSDSVQTVTVQGKNLFDKAKITANKYLLPTNGTLADTAYSNNVSNYVGVQAGNQYTISGNSYVQPTGANVGLAWFTSALVYISGTSYGGATGNGTYTAPANAAYLRYTVNAVDINTSQVELGATATAYETFVPNSPSPDYPSPITSNVPAGTYKISDGVDWYEFTLDDDLRGVDGVVDSLVFDKVGHSGSVNKKVVKKIYNGSTENWSIQTILNNTIRFICITYSDVKAIPLKIISTHFIGNIYDISDTEHVGNGGGNITSYLWINKNRLSTQDTTGLKAWLAANPVTVVYQLATPTTTTITFSKNNASTAPTIPSAYTYSPSENLTAPLTLDVVSGSIYTVSCKTGTITLSGAGTGTVTPTSPITFTAGSTALTLTPAPTATYVQVELKAYSTSWQMGKVARTVEKALGPASALSVQQGTIEFDVYINNIILALSSGGRVLFGNSLSANRLMIGIYLGEIFGSSIKATGDRTDTPQVSVTSYLGQKIRCAMIWDATILAVYINGNLVTYVNNPKLPTTAFDWGIGNDGGSLVTSTLFSNVRMSSKVRTAAELAYTGDLAVDEYTTFFAPLKNSLSAFIKNSARMVRVVNGTGNKAFVETTEESIAINQVSLMATPGINSQYAKVKDVRVFELSQGSIIADDFNTLTADELALKYPWVNVDPYYIKVTFINSLGIPSNMNDVYNAVRQIIPAHLGVTYEFKYRRHEEFKVFTHAQLAAYTHARLREGDL